MYWEPQKVNVPLSILLDELGFLKNETTLGRELEGPRGALLPESYYSETRALCLKAVPRPPDDIAWTDSRGMSQL
jgi:hypothetical protein